MLKTRSWRKHIAFLLNYMRVQSCRSLETFHLSFCGASFWPWFSPWLFTRTYLPFSDSYLKVDSFVFSPGLHRCPLRSLVQRLVFTTYVSIFSSGRFWLTLLCYPIPLYGVNTVVTLGFAFHLLSPFCLGLVRDFGGRGAGFVARCVAAASLGLVGTRLLPTSSLAVHQRVTANLR